MKGLQLSKGYYLNIVKPLLKKYSPTLKYSAALIGPGSEVLGFDDKESQDHHWGPRLLLFLNNNNFKSQKRLISKYLSDNLPKNYAGFSTHFSKPDGIGVRLLEKAPDGPINHMIDIFCISDFLKRNIGIKTLDEISLNFWRKISNQNLLEITSGEVFHDGLKQLNKIRKKLKYFPKKIWLERMAALWYDLSQEEAFVGRCGFVKDEVGSSLIASRQIDRIMNLSFLQEKKYIPYSKWKGTAFKKLIIAPKLQNIFTKILNSEKWQDRQKYLHKAYEVIAENHNKLKITPKINSKAHYFHERPYLVISGYKFSSALLASSKGIK